MTSKAFIQCENLIKIYRINDVNGSSDASLEVQALQGLDLTVAEGEMIGVVGASGSGKSTLLNILGGLDRPNGGRAMVDQQDLGKLSQRGLDQYRRKTVGFVWQYGARNLIPYLTALENIQLPMTLSGKVGKKTSQFAIELLEQVCLGDRQDHRLEELSGGEQQRVAVAIALANRPRLLLADEPTGELDTATAKTIYDLFRDLNRKLGLTIVIVSHDPGIAQHVDRVVAVRDGKLASESVRLKNNADGTLEEHMHAFEELAVLDSAGRLSIPREYLEHFHIRRRVRMEIVEGGILIQPPANSHADLEHTPASATVAEKVEEDGDRPRIPDWLNRSSKLIQKLGARIKRRDVQREKTNAEKPEE
jgi:ABC-type lipoprotein export system ATPase subunit/bifunctional DNA-binding transcriptional regulator/antitoxin component of YhaV-PrlF toxin-antitoxin module